MAAISHQALGLAAMAARNGAGSRGPRPDTVRARFTRDGGDAEQDWRKRAACVNEDPELFSPIGSTGPAMLQIDDAKAVCRRCAAIDACLAFAVGAGIEHGVFGGMSEDERRALKRRAARQRARTGAQGIDETEDGS